MPNKITEEQMIHPEWYEEAKKVTVETLPNFIKKMTEQYEHDYGTICHAITASAIAAASAVNKSSQGGITGFQASCVMWGFITHYMHYDVKEPMRLTHYKNMLFPQYEKYFTSITSDTHKWLMEEAKKLLSEPSEHVSENVTLHWKKIAAGEIPFGVSVVD